MTAPLESRADIDVERIPLGRIDVSDPKLYQDDVWYPYFARLRCEDPVHYCRESPLWTLLVGDQVQKHHAG